MKRAAFTLALLVAFTATGCASQHHTRHRDDRVVVVHNQRGPDRIVVVHQRPPKHRPHVRKPRRPSRRHVWIGGYWDWRGHKHVWVSGRWAVPPRPGARWVTHRWDRHSGGWVFVKGYWRY